MSPDTPIANCKFNRGTSSLILSMDHLRRLTAIVDLWHVTFEVVGHLGPGDRVGGCFVKNVSPNDFAGVIQKSFSIRERTETH